MKQFIDCSGCNNLNTIHAYRILNNYFPDPWHYHENYEFFLVNKSSGYRIVGDHIGDFKEGDLVFLGPNLPHVWVNRPEFFNGSAGCKADGIVVHFKSDFLGSETMLIPEMTAVKYLLHQSQCGVIILGETKRKVKPLILRMLKSTRLTKISILLSIFQILIDSKELQQLARPSYMNLGVRSDADKRTMILDYIYKNFDSKIKLGQIADLVEMSQTSFSIYFKHHFNMTFIEFLNSVKMRQACLLMRDGAMNISEIAQVCGFNNRSNFNRQFKKHIRMSPRDFRKHLILNHETITNETKNYFNT